MKCARMSRNRKARDLQDNARAHVSLIPTLACELHTSLSRLPSMHWQFVPPWQKTRPRLPSSIHGATKLIDRTARICRRSVSKPSALPKAWANPRLYSNLI